MAMTKIEVPYIDQSIKHPTGCESVSAVMLLQYLKYDITVDEFIEKYLEKQEFEERGGQLYGPDPNQYFCGSPYDENSFGCYAPVICKALKKLQETLTISSMKPGHLWNICFVSILIRECQ